MGIIYYSPAIFFIIFCVLLYFLIKFPKLKIAFRTIV